ncbi:MAG: tetratricopeptide repeat protein [Bryobacteraceae bacterium]
MIMAHYKSIAGLLAILLLPACGPRRAPAAPNTCAGAPAQLRHTWNALQEIRGSAAGCTGDFAVRCDYLRSEIDRLGQNCQTGGEALLASAILAFDDRQLAKAQQYLDNLLSSQQPNPDAAVLRARVAIDEGNLPFALRFLAEHVRLRGDHAGLREVYASALFLNGASSKATEQLDAAQQLGAPVWRVEYGKGLIAEAANEVDEAVRHFTVAAKERPDWPLPAARLRALATRSQKKD